jgi:hypothetical protein
MFLRSTQIVPALMLSRPRVKNAAVRLFFGFEMARASFLLLSRNRYVNALFTECVQRHFSGQ